METLKTEKKSNNVLFAVIFLAVIIIIVIVIIKPFSIFSIYEPLSKGKVLINGQTTISVEIAKTPEQQEIGLKGREKLNDGNGMLFVYKDKRYYNFWMDGMKIPIDIIWIDDNKIIDITKNAPVPADLNNPDIFRPASEVNYVLEVKAGYADKNNIKIGDTVEYLIK